MYNLASWFIMPLFFVEVYNVLFRKCISLIITGKIKEIIYICIALMLGMLGIYLSIIGFNNTYKYGLALTRTLHFIPFYCMGYFYKKNLEDRDKLPNIIYFCIVVGLELVIIIYKGAPMSWQQAWSYFSEFNAWPFIVGFLGIAFWLRIAKILEPAIGKSKVVNLIANNTFSIMVNHFLGFMLIKSFFAFLFLHTNRMFSDFNWGSFSYGFLVLLSS